MRRINKASFVRKDVFYFSLKIRGPPVFEFLGNKKFKLHEVENGKKEKVFFIC